MVYPQYSHPWFSEHGLKKWLKFDPKCSGTSNCFTRKSSIFHEKLFCRTIFPFSLPGTKSIHLFIYIFIIIWFEDIFEVYEVHVLVDKTSWVGCLNAV